MKYRVLRELPGAKVGDILSREEIGYEKLVLADNGAEDE